MPLKKRLSSSVVLLAWVMVVSAAGSATSNQSSPPAPAFEQQQLLQDPLFQDTLSYLAEVFKTMAQNYYHPLKREDFERFLNRFAFEIYPELRVNGRSRSFILWRSAAYLVEQLRTPDDIFSAFYPPKFAQKFEQEALGKKIDLGLVGERTDDGWRISFVEPRSPAFEQGLRAGDVILRIEGRLVADMDDDELASWLSPKAGTVVTMIVRHGRDKTTRTVQLKAKEYFKQTVFFLGEIKNGVYGVRIERFNRMTGTDLEEMLKKAEALGARALILDLRGNPGGPPLAAQEISKFFLKPGEPFAYFAFRTRPPSALRVPVDASFVFDHPLAILIDEKSGSAAELFSGVLQHKHRAVLIGQHSAGQVFLKRMFSLEDGSMILLVVARGHLPDGTVFSFQGLEPDVSQPASDALLDFAAQYILEHPFLSYQDNLGKEKVGVETKEDLP